MFRLLGRDPVKEPLTALERALFLDAIADFLKVEAEKPPDDGTG